MKTCKFGLGILMTFKSQSLQYIRIDYCNAGGSSNPPSLISSLWNKDILPYKKAICAKNVDNECIFYTANVYRDLQGLCGGFLQYLQEKPCNIYSFSLQFPCNL